MDMTQSRNSVPVTAGRHRNVQTSSEERLRARTASTMTFRDRVIRPSRDASAAKPDAKKSSRIGRMSGQGSVPAGAVFSGMGHDDGSSACTTPETSAPTSPAPAGSAEFSSPCSLSLCSPSLYSPLSPQDQQQAGECDARTSEPGASFFASLTSASFADVAVSPLVAATDQSKAMAQVRTIDSADTEQMPAARSDSDQPPISQSEEDKVKDSKAWVRPGPPPLKRGVFEMTQSGTGLISDKYIELFLDGIMYFDASADSSGISTPCSPEGMIFMRDCLDIEPLGDGFELLCTDGTNIIFRGPRNEADSTISDWIDELGEQWAKDKEGRITYSFVNSRSLGFSSKPEDELISGSIFRRSEAGQATVLTDAVLTLTTFCMSPPENDGTTEEESNTPPSPSCIDVKVIQEVIMTSDGFTVETMQGQKESVVVLDDDDREEWATAWDSLLVDGFEKPCEGHWRGREVKKVHECPVEIEINNHAREPGYIVSYTNRLSLFCDADSQRVGVWPSQVRDFRATDDGVVIRTDSDTFHLVFADSFDFVTTCNALESCFSRLPCPEPRAAVERCEKATSKKELPAIAEAQVVDNFLDDAALLPSDVQDCDNKEQYVEDPPPQVDLSAGGMACGEQADTVGSRTSVERVDSGFVVNGVLIGDDDEAESFERKLTEALKKHHEKENTEPARKEDGLPKPGAKLPQKKSLGFVPRCAFVASKGKRIDETPRLTRHVPPESHATSNRGTGVRINTHRAGWQAHGLVERQRVSNPMDRLSRPMVKHLAGSADAISDCAGSWCLL